MRWGLFNTSWKVTVRASAHEDSDNGITTKHNQYDPKGHAVKFHTSGVIFFFITVLWFLFLFWRPVLNIFSNRLRSFSPIPPEHHQYLASWSRKNSIADTSLSAYECTEHLESVTLCREIMIKLPYQLVVPVYVPKCQRTTDVIFRPRSDRQPPHGDAFWISSVHCFPDFYFSCQELRMHSSVSAIGEFNLYFPHHGVKFAIRQGSSPIAHGNAVFPCASLDCALGHSQSITNISQAEVVRKKIGTFRGTCVYCAIFIGILWCTLEPLRPMHTEMNTLWARTQSWTENCLIMIRWLCSGARPGLRKNKLIEMFFSNFSYSSFYSSVCLFLFSKPASEVKPGRAGLVRGWVTVREYAVSWGPFSFAWLQASWWLQQGTCDVFLTSSEGIWLRREPNRVFASGYSASPSQIKAATHVWHSVFPTNRFW